MSREPIFRHYHQDELTFADVRGYRELPLLPSPHDEVVARQVLLDSARCLAMTGFANLRLLFYLFTYRANCCLWAVNPGQPERGPPGVLPWSCWSSRIAACSSWWETWNRLYREQPSLHRQGFEHGGFE